MSGMNKIQSEKWEHGYELVIITLPYVFIHFYSSFVFLQKLILKTGNKKKSEYKEIRIINVILLFILIYILNILKVKNTTQFESDIKIPYLTW